MPAKFIYAFEFIERIDTYSYHRIRPIERNPNHLFEYYCYCGSIDKLKSLELDKIDIPKLFAQIQMMKTKIYELNHLGREQHERRIYGINLCIEHLYGQLYKNLFTNEFDTDI